MPTHPLLALQTTEDEFMELLRDLRKKIQKLEKEKAGLLAEIESLKEKAKVRAQELEDEVGTLRKEVKALERLLNVTDKPRNDEAPTEEFS